MRAAVVSEFGAPELIQIRDNLPLPTITEPNQVLIDVRAVGVNPIDAYMRAGLFGVLSLPYITGFDGAGTVREVGPARSDLKVGDKVWFTSHAMQATAEVAVASDVFKLPEGLSFAEGTCLGIPYCTAHRAMFAKRPIKPSDRLLIHGASGAVGLAACQLAAAAGVALIVGTAGTREGEAVALRNGVHHVVNHRDEKYVQQLKELAPEGFDVIVEMAAGANLATDIDLLAAGGRVAVVGGAGEISIQPRDLIQKSEASIEGVNLYKHTPAEFKNTADCLASLFASTQFKPVVNKTYPLEETSQCHKDLMDKNLPTVGNRVIIIQ